MGILNLTPDSFSDGGRFNTLKKALKHAQQLEKEGADIIDIGGESVHLGGKIGFRRHPGHSTFHPSFGRFKGEI